MAANDRVSRSFALEQTYVHEVYEQYYDNPRSKPWPKVSEFLEKIEPGSLVCDVGCGNGKYLKANTSIYTLGGEKSIRLSDLARQKQNEIIRLDNLVLPFKDNCFDTVLSISVVHHFATTDRRVSALREMARVLRVGGRMIITVWAMEQEHRKFESQDVLVPWRKPKLISTSCEMTSATNSEDDSQHAYHAYTQSDSDSNKSFRFRNTFKRKTRASQRKGRSIDPSRKASTGSSSLSSPSETCYGFVRRALQKIAGGGRRVVASTWFLDNWIACMHKQQPMPKRYDPDGCEYCECCGCDTVEDQPIELLRIDDEEPREIPRRRTCPVSQMSADIDAFKSKSMTNIKSVQENNNNRCKPPKLKQDNQSKDIYEKPLNPTTKNTLAKPKLVKQKKSLCDEDADEALDQPTDMKDLVRALPDFKAGLTRYDRGGVLKQRSLNEEILSIDRLREKERLKQNIQKQTSLNEDLFYKRQHTFESLKDSFFAVATSKSFQMFKNGLTNRIKNSTTMEKVTSASLKNGFVKIFQTWKGTDLISPTTRDNENIKTGQNCFVSDKEQNEKTGERRSSKEDGSDSSKDSSLQSDTSVDSEDSFASVIFVPKSDPMSPIGCGSLSAGPASPLVRGGCQSAPQSPRIKQSSCPTSPRVKQLPNGIHPLTKQLSSPKPSTELLSTATAFFPADEKNCEIQRTVPIVKTIPPTPIAKKENPKIVSEKYAVPKIPKFRRTSLNTPTLRENNTLVPSINTIVTSLTDTNTNTNINTNNVLPTINTTSPDKSPPDGANTIDASRAEKLKKIREMLSQKPGFGSKSRNHCPIVRKISDSDNKDESLAKPIPKLLKLDIFNPEEDDDSDGSCVSSPDSIDSVISIKSNSNDPLFPSNRFQFPNTNSQGKPMSLLEAAANVANSLDEAVEKVISSRPKKKLPTVDVFSILQRRFSSDTTPLLDDEDESLENGESRRSSSTWNEECHKHLTAFADKLSEKLMKELDEYQVTMDNIDDPYIHRLSEELHDLSILSDEIKKQNEYLTRLSRSTNNNQKKKPKNCTKCKKHTDCHCNTLVNRTRNRTKNEVLASLVGNLEDNMSSQSAKSVSEVLPSVNNTLNSSVNPALTNYSKTTTNASSKSEIPSNVNVNQSKHDANLLSHSGQRVDNLVYSSGDGDQWERNREGSMVDIVESGETGKCSGESKPMIMKRGSTDSCDSADKVSGSSSNSIISSGATSINFGGPSMTSSAGDLTGDSKDGGSNGGSTASLISLESRTKSKLEPMDTLSPGNLTKRDPSGLSDISQDSSWPSEEVGGEITYHRYYHVFRKGELERLIEKYVDDLHVVSSTYEHASWCIIAEKVQIWTI